MSQQFPFRGRYRSQPFGGQGFGYERSPPMVGLVSLPFNRQGPSMALVPQNLRNSPAALYAFERVKHLHRFTTVFVGNIHPKLEDHIVERLLSVRISMSRVSGFPVPYESSLSLFVIIPIHCSYYLSSF